MRRAFLAAILIASVWGISQTKSSTGSTGSKSGKKSTSSKKKSSSSKKSTSKTTAKRVPQKQQQPDGERSRQIQDALKSQGYLTGESSGKWDSATQAALAKYQQDHGSKPTGKPDAHSLIGLGLGPKYDNQIQPPAKPSTPQIPQAHATTAFAGFSASR